MMKTEMPQQDPTSSVWLWGLLSIAWADGHLDQAEQDIIADFWSEDSSLDTASNFEPLPAERLAETFGNDPETAENFMRTAVMVALADGIYSTAEDECLERYCQSLGLNLSVLDQLRTTLDGKPSTESDSETGTQAGDLLDPVRHWLDGVQVKDPKVAKFLCRLIPSDCPFERDVVLFGKKLVHIPAMCKINPLYEQLVGLRFRSLSFLADDCQEDVTPYL